MFEFLYGFYGFIAVKLIILHLLLTGLILYMKLLKKDGIEQIGAAIIGECLTIISWYMLPSTIATILCAAAFIYSYEYLSAPKVKQGRNVILESDHDIGQTLRQEQLGLQFEDESQSSDDGLYRVKTNLSYIEVINIVQGENFSTYGIINIDKISRIEPSTCKAAVVPSLSDKENCFDITLEWEQKQVTICAETRGAREKWKSCLEKLVRYGFERRRNEFERKIFRRVTEKHILEDGTRYMDRELAVNTINNDMGFPLDINSVKEFFKTHAIRSKDLQYLDCDKFTDFYRSISQIPSITSVYERLLADDYVLGVDKIKGFIEREQKEKFSISLLKLWMKNTEKIAPLLNFSQDGFTKFLLSPEQSIFNREFTVVYQDMKRPLCDYFIATSHNTYLTGDQLKSKSDVNMYVKALSRSCRCVELDIWDGKTEPMITHGHTLCSKIPFLDVIKAIRKYAFDERSAEEGEGDSWEDRLKRMRNPYPVILSFENHCNLENQRIMADMLRKELGEHLLTELPSGCTDTLPSPHDLRGKIIIKAKKLLKGAEEESESESDDDDDEIEDVVDDIDSINNEEIPTPKTSTSDTIMTRKSSIFSPAKSSGSPKKVKLKVAKELSDLVIICQAVHFKSFEDSAKNQNAHQMSSFAEGRSLRILKDEGKLFLKYNQKQLSRIYPHGKRVNSSNYDPVPLWCAGSQLVALNYQTSDRAMQTNQGQFRDNGACGYVLKPDIMQKAEYSPNNQELKIQNFKILVLKIISGHQLPATDKLFVQVQINGYEGTKDFKTTKQRCDGLIVEWNEQTAFKILLPELSHVSFRVKKASKDSDLAQYTSPFRCLQQGFRRVPLCDSKLNTLQYGCLFVHVEIKDSILTSLNN